MSSAIKKIIFGFFFESSVSFLLLVVHPTVNKTTNPKYNILFFIIGKKINLLFYKCKSDLKKIGLLCILKGLGIIKSERFKKINEKYILDLLEHQFYNEP